MLIKKATRVGLAAAAILALAGSAQAGGTLRVALTATDVPTTTGAPDNGGEGIRFLGFPVFESLVLWDLTRADKLADIRPGLAESWEQDANDKTKWVFHLRKGVKFHDGSDFNADAAIWNLDRFFKQDAPQFDPPNAAVTQARIPFVVGYRKIDGDTIEIANPRPLSYFPYMMPYMLNASPAQFKKTGSWAEFAKAPSGTGPFQITEFKPRVSATLNRNDGYWDKSRVPRLDKMVLFPIPEATTRLAALRSGQVDWIEVPPPDAVPSLKAAGFEIVTNSYPHSWPWTWNLAKADAPWRDIRVRHAINYCVNRDGLVTLLNGLAEPSFGIFKNTERVPAAEPEGVQFRHLVRGCRLGDDVGCPAQPADRAASARHGCNEHQLGGLERRLASGALFPVGEHASEGAQLAELEKRGIRRGHGAD